MSHIEMEPASVATVIILFVVNVIVRSVLRQELEETRGITRE